MSTKKTTSFALLRVQTDLEGFSTLDDVNLKFTEPGNLFDFIVRFQPKDGFWKRGHFDFHFHITEDFPFMPPVVKCETRIWHPNIDESGAVCLNILKKNYTPVTPLASLVVGLQYLLISPNPDDPLNKEAAEQMQKDITKFEKRVNDYIDVYCPKSDKFEDDNKKEPKEEKK